MNSSVSNQTAIANWLIAQLSDQLSLEKSSISVSEPLTRYGLDSIDAVTMVGDIEDILRCRITFYSILGLSHY